ncbi:MAG: hypothetical protein M0Z87_10605 [Actinomycetota bacterium]|nr:hypothetical protein [Actinomycetota bacterium]
MLVPRAATAAVIVSSRRYYPTDVAAATESERRLQERPARSADVHAD